MAPAHVAPAGARAQDELLFSRYRAGGDRGVRDALVRRFLPLARTLARRYASTGEPLDDLMQVASLGLLKAIDRFDPARGSAFTSFAVPTILGELRRYFRDHGWSVRVPRDRQELSRRLDVVGTELTAELGRAPSLDELAGQRDQCGFRVGDRDVAHVVTGMVSRRALARESNAPSVAHQGQDLLKARGLGSDANGQSVAPLLVEHLTGAPTPSTIGLVMKPSSRGSANMT